MSEPKLLSVARWSPLTPDGCTTLLSVAELERELLHAAWEAGLGVFTRSSVRYQWCLDGTYDADGEFGGVWYPYDPAHGIPIKVADHVSQGRVSVRLWVGVVGLKLLDYDETMAVASGGRGMKIEVSNRG